MSAQPDLVCPAGTPAALRDAVDAGADSVYCGFQNATNARNFPGLNFTLEELRASIAYAHERSAKVLLAINTFPPAGQFSLWRDAIDAGVSLGVDAIIVADIGVAAYAARAHPRQRLHLSVQASASSSEAIRYYCHSFGIKRVVLPRILTVAEIKQIAADMGSGQYQILAIYAASKGLDLKKDITIVNANFAVARAQLAAGRVEAAMVIEPIATLMLKENPKLTAVFEANKAWKELTGSEGWELVYAMREDSIKRVPNMPKMFLAALQDVSAFLKSNPEEADKIASETVKLPPGTLKEAVASGRWAFDAKPAWGDERKVIWNMLERAVQAGFHPKVPDESFIYAP